MKFLVNIEEVVCEKFEVDAESMEEAQRIVKRAYESGEIVLEPGELVEKRIAVFDEATNEWSEYEEFWNTKKYKKPGYKVWLFCFVV